MKIFNFGLNLDPKKYTYQSGDFKKIVDKFSPKKKTPYMVEVIDSGPESAEVTVIEKNKVVDLCLSDLEKIEQRLFRTGEKKEKEILEEAQSCLEEEKLLSSCGFSEDKLFFLNNLQLLSLKPLLIKEDFDGSEEKINKLIEEAIEAAGRILFFTVSEKEAKAWDLKKGKAVLEAAGRIHSDLMRGFIRADVVNSSYLDDFHNMAEAKNKGFVKTVGKDYIVESGDIIQIKFNL